ncbi:hypothetical protein VBZ51_08345 [Maribacter sp. HS]|uniref:hypothetical protein n=1 Tax=Maribacter sp. HS TaxID=3110480 RepID=UPI003A843929
MQKNKTTPANISECFTPELTKSFKLEADIALKTMKLDKVILVLQKYGIDKFQDSIDFIEALSEIFVQWKKEGQGSVLVDEVTTSGSKCIACEIGKNVVVYDFSYQHMKAPEPMNRLVYGWDFGILFDIRNEILFEIRVCNAFLNKSDLQKLRIS